MARGRPRRPTPEELLDPRSKPTVEDLFHAIHEVNPTDRGLSVAETSRRYGLKARLQSLLLKRHAHAVDVVEEEEGRVLLRHSRGERDFCHALLAELDDEARSIARRSLDVPREEAPPPGAPAAPRTRSTSRDALAAAREALEAWDLEGARALLEPAHRAGNAEATGLLVDLLVDTLADDEAAMALEVAADAPLRVRARLALAAARAGQSGRSLRLLDGVGPTEAAEARIHLARAALRSGQLAGAVRLLALAREGAPGLSDIAAMEAEVARARKDRVPPLERELEAAVSGGDAERAEAVARDLVELDPNHVRARTLLREIADSRRRQELDALLRDARSAEAAGLWSLARERLAEARERGADVTDEVERVAAAQADHQAKGAVAELVRAAGRGTVEGLVAWLAASPASRARAGLALPELAWFAPDLQATGSKATDLARAAVAARAASDALAAGRAVRALALLREAGEATDLLRGGRATRLRIEAAAREETLNAGRVAVERALAAVDADPERALRELDASGELDEETARRRDEAIPRIRALLAERALERDAEGSDPFVARRAARRLAEANPGPRAERWKARAAALTDELVRRFRVRVWEDPPIDQRDLTVRLSPNGGRWVTADGRLVLVTARVHQVLVRIVDVETWTVRRAIALVTPNNLGRLDWCVSGETLTVAGRAPYVLQLSLDGELLDWCEVARCIPPGERVAATLTVPDPGLVWIATAGPEHVLWAVVDVAARRVIRTLSNLVDPCVHAHEPPIVVAPLRGHGLTLWSLDGSSRRALPGASTRWDTEVAPMARSQAPHPERRDSLVALVDAPRLAGTPGPVGWVELRPDVPRPEAHWIERSERHQGAVIATAFDEGLVAIHTLGQLDARQLTALAWTGDDLEDVWRRESDAVSVLASDEGSRRVFVLVTGERGLAGERLGWDPPTLEAVPDRDLFLPEMRLKTCPGPTPTQAQQAAAVDLVREVGPEEGGLRRRLAEATEPDTALSLLLALSIADRPAFEAEAGPTADRFLSEPMIALLAAHQDAEAEHWAVVASRLGPVDPAALGEHARLHLHHLRGLAAWHLGDKAGAARHWGASEPSNHCPNDHLCDQAAAWTELAGTRPGRVGRLAALIARADERLEAGDPRGALEILDDPVAWLARDLQCAARRAAAWLAIETTDPLDELRRLIGAPILREVMELADDDPFRGDLAVPGAWPFERIVEISRGVARALGEPEDWSAP